MNKRFCIPNYLLIIFALLLGVITALVWNAGYIEFVRDTIPYAMFFAVILFIVTAVMKFRCGNSDERCLTPTCFSLRKYSAAVIVASAVFIVFSIVVLATYLPYTWRFILAFIGSISFWTMLLDFTAMIFCILYRR